MKSCVKSISIFLIFVFLWQNQPRSTYATVENGYLPVRQAGLRPLAVGEVESRAARNVTSVNEGRPQAAMEEKRASADGAEPEMSDRKTAINILREIVQKQFKGKMPVYHIGALDIEAMRLLDVAFYGAFTWEGPTKLVIPRYMQIEHPNITLLEIATRIWDLLPDSQKTTSEALAQIVIRADAILGDAFSGFGRRRDVQLARLDTELIESERILLGFNIHELDDNGFAALNRDIREAFRGIAEGQVIPDRWRRFRLTLRELTPLVWDMLPESQRNEPDSAIQIAARLENILRDLSGEVQDKLATKGIDTWDVFDLDQKGGGLPETGPVAEVFKRHDKPEDVELAIARMPNARFEVLAREVDQQCPYDSVATDTFWGGLDEKQQAMVRAVAERELREELDRYCDVLFNAFIHLAQQKRTFNPAIAASYMAYKTGRSLFDNSIIPIDKLTRQTQDFMRKFRPPAARPEGNVIYCLGKMLEPTDETIGDLSFAADVTAFLEHIGSNTRLLMAFSRREGISLWYGKGQIEGEAGRRTFVGEEEWVCSPHLEDSDAISALGYPLIRYPRLRATVRTRYYVALTGSKVETLIKPQSSQGNELRRHVLEKMGITSAAQITGKDLTAITPLIENRKAWQIRHEHGHNRVNDDLGYTHQDFAANKPFGVACMAGNRVGHTLVETLVNYGEGGEFALITDTASEDPEGAGLLFCQILANLLDDHFGRHPTDTSFQIPLFLACIRDDGTVDFERFEDLRRTAYGILKTHLQNLIGVLEPDTQRYMRNPKAALPQTETARAEAHSALFSALLPAKAAAYQGNLTAFINNEAGKAPFCIRAEGNPQPFLAAAKSAEKQDSFYAAEMYALAGKLGAPDAAGQALRRLTELLLAKEIPESPCDWIAYERLARRARTHGEAAGYFRERAQELRAAQPAPTLESNPFLFLLWKADSEQEIDAALDEAYPVQFETIYQRVAAGYPTGQMSGEHFIENLSERECLAIRKVLERDLATFPMPFCDLQFLQLLDGAREAVKRRLNTPEAVQKYALDYMRFRRGLGLQEVLQWNEAEMDRRLSAFEEEMRQGVAGKQIVQGLRMLDTEHKLTAIEVTTDFNDILRRLGSNVRVTGGLAAQKQPSIVVGECREAGNVITFTKELVLSPSIMLAESPARRAGTVLFVRENAVRDRFTELYYLTRGAERIGNRTAVSGHSEYSASCMNRALGLLEVRNDSDFFDRCLPELVKTDEALVMAHERCHEASLKERFSNDMTLYSAAMGAGNRFGLTLEEALVELANGGPIAYIAKLAKTAPEKAETAFWCALSRKAPAAVGGELDPETRGNLFILPAMLVYSPAGEIQFQRMEENRVAIRDFLNGVMGYYLTNVVPKTQAATAESEKVRNAAERDFANMFSTPDLQSYAKQHVGKLLALEPGTGPKGVGQADKGIVRHRGRLAVNYAVAIGLRESLTYLLARDKENNITEGEAQEFRDWFDHLRKPGEDIPPEKMFDKERLADIIAENKKGQILYVVYLPVQNFGYTKNNEPIYAHVNLREGIIWVASGRSREKDNMDVTLARMHETEEYNIATDAGAVTEILREVLGNDSRSVGLLASHLLTAYGNAVNIEEIAKWRDEGSPEAQLFFHFLHREVSAKVLDICGRAADDAPDPGTKAKFDEMKKRAEGLYKLALEIPEPEEPFFTGGIGQTAAGRPRQGGDTGRDKRASASGAAAKRQPAPIPKEALIAI